MRQYGRADVEYETWYTPWMKQLAATKTAAELESLLTGKRREAKAGAMSHLRAIDACYSMAGQSMRKAHARNVTAAAGDYAIAIEGALEIHELFPEHAKHDA